MLFPEKQVYCLSLLPTRELLKHSNYVLFVQECIVFPVFKTVPGIKVHDEYLLNSAIQE